MDKGKKRKVNMSEVKSVSYGVSLLKDRAFRQSEAVQSLMMQLLKANALPEQIEKLKSWESKLEIIKEDIKIILNLPEPEARQKLRKVEMDLEKCKQQLSEVRRQLSKARQQQSLVCEKTRALGEIFCNSEEFSTETLGKVFYSAVPYMKEGAATYDNQMNLVLSGSNKIDGEMGKDPYKMVEPNWSSHRDNGDFIMIPTPGAPIGANGQPLPPDDIQVNCSSSMLTGGKKINHKAKGKGKGIKKQRQPWVTGESSNLGEDNSEEFIWDFSPKTLEKKFYSAVPSMETDGHGILLGNTITSEMLLLQQGGSEASEAQYNMNAPPLSDSDNLMNLMLSGSNKRDGVSEVGGQCTEMNNVTIPVDQDHGSLLVREMLKCNYSSWQSRLFNKDNNSVEVAHFHGLQEALDETRYGETPDYLKHIATQIEVDRGEATKFGHKNIEVLVCAAIKEMEDWRTPKDSGCNQLKKWAATLNMGKEQDFEVKFADDMLNNICLACYAYSMIYGEDGSVHKVASGRV